MELIKMSSKEVAKRMYAYIIRIDNLKNQVSKFMEYNSKMIDAEALRNEYKALKQAIKEDAHYMSLSRNEGKGSSLLQNEFDWVIHEAAAYGFTSSTNSKIDFKFWSSLEEARYKLTKFTSLEKWKELSEK